MPVKSGRRGGSSTHSPPKPQCHREGKEESPRCQLAGSCPLLPEAWRKELKDLASRVAIFTKENQMKNKEVGAEQGSCLGRDEMDPSLCNKIPPKGVQPDQQ